MTDLLLIAHAAVTWYMVGLVWFVQVTHYPLFVAVGREGWVDYARRHQTRTTLVVAPPMLAEICCTALIIAGYAPAAPGLAWSGAVLLLIVWISTFGVQVPIHTRLAARYDAALVRTLVATNWVRTFAWTARAVIAGLMLADAAEGAAP